jgi:hypothetical protein
MKYKHNIVHGFNVGHCDHCLSAVKESEIISIIDGEMYSVTIDDDNKEMVNIVIPQNELDSLDRNYVTVHEIQPFDDFGTMDNSRCIFLLPGVYSPESMDVFKTKIAMFINQNNLCIPVFSQMTLHVDHPDRKFTMFKWKPCAHVSKVYEMEVRFYITEEVLEYFKQF